MTEFRPRSSKAVPSRPGRRSPMCPATTRAATSQTWSQQAITEAAATFGYVLSLLELGPQASDVQPHRRPTMTTGLMVSAILGLATIVMAFIYNRHLFGEGNAGRITPLEGFFYLAGLASLGLGWYFNVRYVHAYKAR